VQILQQQVEIIERRHDRGSEGSVARHRLAHERKRAARPTQGVADEAGLDIGDAVAKAGAGAGMAVMGSSG
jgi:hypothetical protein